MGESWLLWRRWDLATMRMCSMLLKLRMGISEGSEPATGFPNLSGLPPKVSGRPRIDGFLHTLTCVELVLTARVVPQCSACEVHLRGRVCFTVYKICYVVNTK